MSIINQKKSTIQNNSMKKTNTKLPKLTIQQQMDNQQVIDRMNRKITFSKNQRHLGKTLQYNEVLGQEVAESFSKNFSAEPSQILFTDYRLNTTYEAQIKLVNKSKLIQRIKITPLKKKQFVVTKVTYPHENTGDIAPGMAVTVAVRFRPANLHDNQDQLLVIVPDGLLRIPIWARRQKCKGQWPSSIECGHCWVGDKIQKQFNVKNKGGQAVYRLKHSVQDKMFLEKGYFTIFPTVFQVSGKAKEKNLIKVRFQPLKAGLFEQQIIYVSDQGEEEEIRIKLNGGAYTAHLTLNEINNQKVIQQKFQNNLYITNCEPGQTSYSKLKIHNHAVVPVDYFWHSVNDFDQLNIRNKSGKIMASEILEFEIAYNPTSNAPKIFPIHLYLYNLPEQSITNSNVKMIDGIKSIQCFQILVRTTSKESMLQVMPLHQRIVEQLYVGRPKVSTFKIFNYSHSQRKCTIHFVKKSDEWNFNCDNFIDNSADDMEQEEFKKAIRIGKQQSFEVKVQFEATQITSEVLYAYLLVSFDNAPARMVSFEGTVEFPNVKLFTTQIDFELVRERSEFRKQFKICNEGDNQIKFRIKNPYRFYMLDFYDLYQFQDESFYLDRLKISSSKGECGEWFSIPSNSEEDIQFQLHTYQQESIELDLQLEVLNGPTYNLTVTAEVQGIIGNISRNSISLKQIYKGNIYNSNKFLSRELAIHNTGNLGFSFEVEPDPVEQCSIKFSELSSTVDSQSKKRLDVTLEPIKTGKFMANYKVKYYDDIPVYPSQYSELVNIIQKVPEKRKSWVFTEQLKIEAEVRGVQIHYYIKDESRVKKVRQKMEDPIGSVKLSTHSYKSGSRSHYLDSDKLVYPTLQQINFYNCEINKVQQMEIIIENDSGLTAEYQIYAQKFRTEVSQSPKSRSKNSGLVQEGQQAFTSEMGKNYLQARVLDKAQKVHLSNNKGISIMCEPSSGQLHKKQQQKIIITMFNDTSGRFKDQLIISIKDHEIKKFPITMQIKGTPVTLSRNQLGINFNLETPLMNTGTFFPCNGKVTKNIKVINNGPKEVYFNWIVYNYSSDDKQKDFFEISFNEAEPGSGNLVETKWNPIKPSVCQKSPFTLSPAQKTIKGRQQVTFTLTIQQCQKLGCFNNLLVGVPYMIQGDGQKRQMECLAVVLEGQCVSPRLRLDQKHKNHIQKFSRFAVMGNQQSTKANDFHRKIKLKNMFRANITFSIDIETEKSKFENFQIVSTATDSPLNKLKSVITNKTINSSTKLKSIRPPTFTKAKIQEFEIQKQFTLPFQSYIEIGVDLCSDPNNFEDWPVEEKLRKNGKLKINFSNGQTQQIELAGWLYRPSIQIQMPNSSLHSNENMIIDFGTVHVKNSKKMPIYLANPSKSAANWNISYIKYHQSKKIIFQKQLWTDQDYEDETITDEKKCFRLSQDSGHLLAQSIPIHYMPNTLALTSRDDGYAETHKPIKVDFLFKPESNILYKSKFILKVEHGWTYQVIVKGRGTYEQEKEIK